MPFLPKLKSTPLWLMVGLILANGLIIANLAPGLRYVAALVLLTFLPGWAWLQAFAPSPLDGAERVVFAVGLSLALTIAGTMLAVYLPGPLSLSKLLVMANGLTLTGMVVSGWKRRAGSLKPEVTRSGLRQRSYLILAGLLILAAALRLPRLGYAEFHEDEAETLMLGVRLLQGEDYALFLHRKGPAQMLVPVAFWLLTNRIDESLARFPFALSSILSVATLFFMGRRWFHWTAGAVAGLLWAINGYSLGFGRMVQYQALIFFLGPLAIYALYLAWIYRQTPLQIIAAILLAVCLLAHFDALLLLPAAGYVGWVVVRGVGSGERRAESGERRRVEGQGSGGAGEQGSRGAEARGSRGAEAQGSEARGAESGERRRARGQEGKSLVDHWADLRGIILGVVVFVGLLGAFYVPYTLDPEFQNTATYLAESRVKPGWLYNNLNLLQRLDKDYSSHFYLPLLAVGIVIFGVWQSFHFSSRRRWGMIGLGLLLWSTVWLPDWWQSGPLSLAVVPWSGFLLVVIWLSPTIETRTAWLMLGAALVGYVFLVDDPRTHLYILYPGAVLLAGAGWGLLLRRQAFLAAVEKPVIPALRVVDNESATRFRELGRFNFILVAIGLVFISGIIVYEATIFLQTESTLARIRKEWDGSLRKTVYDDLPSVRSYFGYPKREGWKAIGALRAQGMFPGDFRSVNEDFIVPIWYNYGEARSCYDTPAHFFVRTPADAPPTSQPSYVEVGQIQREAEIRLRIFSAEMASNGQPITYLLSNYTGTFDALATPQQFTQQAEPAQLVGTRFGSAIEFVGYDLPQSTVAPGETLYVNLYWQALAAPGDRYRAFVHLTDGTTLWAQQDDDPACRLPTTIWRAGQHGVGQFRLHLDPNTPPGRYPLIIGLYQAGTLERLKITAGAGQPGDDFLWLGDIEVVAPGQL